MRRRLLILSILSGIIVLFNIPAQAFNFANETLHYRVEYKWGLVNKTAGNVSISLSNKPDRYACRLTGASAKWADKIYKVRDTLKCEVMKNGFLPVFYEKNSHEGGDDKHDYVAYSYRGNSVTGNCVRKKWEGGKLTTDETRVLQAEGLTLDILSSFYYMRGLPYQEWTKGHTVKLNIFSGKRKELLTIKYVGDETVTINKTSYDCYHIKFSFTSKGGKKSSDDMDAWICKTGNHIPVKLEGSLPIGKIRCFYTPQ